jgi:hypothetical protein
MLMRKAGVNVAERALPALLVLVVVALLFYGASPTGFPVIGGVDLVVTNMSWSPLGPVTGNAVTITAAVLNDGDNAAVSFNVAFYVDGSLMDTESVASLAAGAKTVVTFSWTAFSGGHEFKVLADSGSSVAEVNENNNDRYETVGVDYPMKGQTMSRTSPSNAVGPTDMVLKQSVSGTFDPVASTLVYNGTVYVSNATCTGCSGSVVAYNASNISQLIDSTTTLNSVREFAIYKGVLYTPVDNNRVYAFNASNLSQNFGFFQKPGPVYQIDHLAFYRNYVYATSYENVYELNASNISQRITNFSTFGSGDTFSLPAVYNGTLYVGTDTSRTLYALNASNVTQKLDSFTHPDVLIPHIYSPAIANGVVYVAGGDYRFWALDANNLNHVLSSTRGVGQPDFGVPPTVWDDKVAYGSITVPTKATLMVFNASNVGQSLYNITVGVGTDEIMWPALVTNNGVLYFASESNSIYARSATDLSALSSYAAINDLTSFAIGPDGVLYAPTFTRLYALKQRPSVTPTGPVDYTQVDRDAVNASVGDVITLEAQLEDGANGVTVSFSIDQNAPTYSYSTSVSNTSVNGVARYYLNPSSSYYAGEYVWSPSAAGYSTSGSRYFNLYGGLEADFKSNSSRPNTAASYQSGNTVEVAMNLTSMGPEAVPDLFNDYNATVSATLTPPTEAPVTFALQNRTDTTVGLLGTGTANSACDVGADDYIDFNNNLVPSPVPNGGGSDYYVKWTCNAATCPGYSGSSYSIIDAGNLGSWNGLDYLELQGFGPATLCPDPLVFGWTFNVTGQSIDRFWYGNYTLATEGGTWSASGNASAVYFFSNSSGRSFTVTGAAAAPSAAPAGGGGESYIRNVTVDATNNIAIEAGANKLTLGKGATEHIKVTISNLGSVPLYDVEIEAMGLPQDWVTVTPSKIDTLWRGEPAELDATIQVPDTAAAGTYTLAFTAHNVYVQDSYPIELTITGACECPAAGEWNECVEGKQSRTNYKCDAETGYVCEQFTEERGCVTKPVVTLLIVVVVGAIIGAAAVSGVLWFRPGRP